MQFCTKGNSPSDGHDVSKIARKAGDVTLKKQATPYAPKPNISMFHSVDKSSVPINIRKVNLRSKKPNHLFDEKAALKILKSGGMTSPVAETVVEVTRQCVQALHRDNSFNLLTRQQEDVSLGQVMDDISRIRRDMIILEKSEFFHLKQEYETQRKEIDELKSILEKEVIRLEERVKSDIQMQVESRKEDHNWNEKRLALLTNSVEKGITEQQKKIESINSELEKAISILLVTFEGFRNNFFKYFLRFTIGSLLTTLFFYRIWI